MFQPSPIEMTYGKELKDWARCQNGFRLQSDWPACLSSEAFGMKAVHFHCSKEKNQVVQNNTIEMCTF